MYIGEEKKKYKKVNAFLSREMFSMFHYKFQIKFDLKIIFNL